MIRYINKKETAKEHKHIDVRFGKDTIGYIVKPESNGSWHFNSISCMFPNYSHKLLQGIKTYLSDTHKRNEALVS